MKLYHTPLSGHAHRAVLFASLLRIEVELIDIDIPGGANRTAEFLALNPFGQVPVLADGATVVADSNAILVYLAKKAGRTDWLPEDPAGAAAVQRWLSVAAGELAYGPASARLITVFGARLNPEEVIARAHVLLERLEAHLTTREWLAADHPTIADIALYSYLAGAPEGNVELAPYTAVRAFLQRVEALPGFVPFPETVAGLRA
ncbi:MULTISPECIES: glutathione S-transferase family protein [Pseudomonas]|uniref:Glutathione S-transferase n=1 Tax=Pseudomonas oryzihabitans TaxID=47885 RepID=A0A0U4WH40_9PSED|nr:MULTISPECIES: glutathione S-transferase [Pseudomonas]ALZ84626.1 glutathione S-transferase [Pseudomonas oryzihabitans]WCE09378.1 glutathione S-transferase [Pseudomonas sp. JBR1]